MKLDFHFKIIDIYFFLRTICINNKVYWYD